MEHKPLIGIIMDEDTSKGGRFYDTNKGYFNAVHLAGGIPIGIPYIKDAGDFAFEKCDGLLSTGARVRFDDSAYIDGEESHSPQSDRFAFERDLVKRFVDADRPYLGICNGMQVLGVVYGSRLTYRLVHHLKTNINHNDNDTLHKIIIEKNSLLHDIIGEDEIITNTRHNEGLLEIGENVLVSAKCIDGAIEAIEIKGKKFAIGVQWHPELLWPNDEIDCNISDVSNKLFHSFISSCAL